MRRAPRRRCVARSRETPRFACWTRSGAGWRARREAAGGRCAAAPGGRAASTKPVTVAPVERCCVRRVNSRSRRHARGVVRGPAECTDGGDDQSDRAARPRAESPAPVALVLDAARAAGCSCAARRGSASRRCSPRPPPTPPREDSSCCSTTPACSRSRACLQRPAPAARASGARQPVVACVLDAAFGPRFRQPPGALRDRPGGAGGAAVGRRDGRARPAGRRRRPLAGPLQRRGLASSGAGSMGGSSSCSRPPARGSTPVLGDAGLPEPRPGTAGRRPAAALLDERAPGLPASVATGAREAAGNPLALVQLPLTAGRSVSACPAGVRPCR